MKILNNYEARLVINLRLYKNAEEKNAEQKMWNGKMRIYPKSKTFNCAFFEYRDSWFFVKFVTFFDVLVLVLA